MGIYLSRKDAFVAEHFLDDSEIGSVLDHMGCEGMPEGMRRDAFAHTSQKGLFLYHVEHGYAAQRFAKPVQEYGVLG